MATPTSPLFSGPAKALIIVAAFVVTVAGMRAASPILVPLLLAMFVASICAPAFFAMQRLRMPPLLALMTLLLALVALSLLTAIIIQVGIGDLRDKLPDYQAIVQRQFEELVIWLKTLEPDIDDEEFRALFDWRSAFAFLRSSLTKATGFVGQTLFVLLLTAFILLEAQYLPCKLHGIPEFSPAFWRQFDQILSDVRRYMSMKTLTSAITGGLVLLWVMALDVNFAPLLGFLAFVLNYIPIIGSVIAGVPGVALALVEQGPGTALLCALGYIAINAGISNILEPRLMGRGLGLSPLVVIVSLVFWGWVFGPVGMLLSLPLTKIAKIIMEGFPDSRWVAALLGGPPTTEPPAPHHPNLRCR
ncbi:MAG: AI-2E family transporter [Chromatiaceae bacterium]|nr:AI-2E family transporter [Chromatiaceae bacterium]MCF7997371.1 AI-2E family transporter [Chromatiaceae bacterium]MCF8017319.1 AI-2E family transporter [Chromatiaceae bacterium]